ncbi:tRNA glutamyl-Q(34) synthetase GluQRS [Gallaecimonas kandeliae]|uniref:tRNA glutamyl-Q(34) synthetase GluQRS n=1 Tax=Gallaecimonas kandeliae TaxID=3029055 RepID=UPI002648102B|nr:tRNA glutamyl-Q(34) synthetase GluQRS [Gallaecimonas kandeliae]WKE66309.1 tRNA glutamyl-Q(34) synthetase GluQRS [Gallaecimonas kandeliae]
MTGYVGRFAPSPSGPLHLGSLVAALGSFLDARAHGGRWLVRIEDIDPPREMPGASSAILRTLEAFGLHWDGEVRYQSRHHQDYDALLARLGSQGHLYRCACTRKQLKEQGLHLRATCNPPAQGAPAALRFRNDAPITGFWDRAQGQVTVPQALAAEDFIIHRKDGLYAYQLAVVADDIDQGMTHIVRGSDLVEASVWQLQLYRALGAAPCSYLHLPLVLGEDGQKLSKQNHAAPIDDANPLPALRQALWHLGQQVPQADSVEDLLKAAVTQWSHLDDSQPAQARV